MLSLICPPKKQTKFFYSKDNAPLTSARPSACDTCCAKLVLVVTLLLPSTSVPAASATLLSTSCAASPSSSLCAVPSISVCNLLKNQSTFPQTLNARKSQNQQLETLRFQQSSWQQWDKCNSWKVQSRIWSIPCLANIPFAVLQQVSHVSTHH